MNLAEMFRHEQISAGQTDSVSLLEARSLDRRFALGDTDHVKILVARPDGRSMLGHALAVNVPAPVVSILANSVPGDQR